MPDSIQEPRARQPTSAPLNAQPVGHSRLEKAERGSGEANGISNTDTTVLDPCFSAPSLPYYSSRHRAGKKSQDTGLAGTALFRGAPLAPISMSF